MKKLSKKAVALLMSLCLGTTLCPVAGVSAAQSDDICSTTSQVQIEPRYSYIRSTSAAFYPTGSFVVKVTGSSDVISVAFSVQLERKATSWYAVGDPLEASRSGNYGSYNDSFDLEPSGTYRIKVTYKVFTENGSETTVKYTEA